MTPKEAAEAVLHYNRTKELPDGGVDNFWTAIWSLLEMSIDGKDIRPLLKGWPTDTPPDFRKRIDEVLGFRSYGSADMKVLVTSVVGLTEADFIL